MHNLFAGDELPANAEEFVAYKPIGLTPRELVDEYLRMYPDQFWKGSFSGRLDPMAHGAIHLFFNGLCSDASKYHGRAKCYQFKMIIGVGTSSLDLMGFANILPTSEETEKAKVTIDAIDRAICEKQLEGRQQLPACCSHPVRNSAGLRKPLWWWSLMGRLEEVRDQIPTLDRSIYRWEILGMREIILSELCDMAIERVNMVNRRNVFKQDEIIGKWRELRDHIGTQRKLFEVTIEIEVSAGFYIRKLVEDIGTKLGLLTTTAEIQRMYYGEL